MKNSCVHQRARKVPASHKASLAAAEELAESDPTNVNLRSLAVLYEEIGDIHDKAQMFSAALANYEQSQKVFERTVAAGKGYTVAQQDFLRPKHKTSRMQMACGSPLAALISEREALAIADPILLANPDDRNCKMFVASIMLFTAHAAAPLGAVEEALAATDRGLELLESVASMESQNPVYQRSLTSFKELKFALGVLPAWAWPPIQAVSQAVRLLKRLKINRRLAIRPRLRA